MKIKIIIAAIVVVLIVAIPAYIIKTGSDEPTSGENGAPFRIGIMPDVAGMPFVVGKNRGIFEKAGLNVELTLFRSAQDRDAALQAGQLEATSSDLLSLFLLREAGVAYSAAGHTSGHYAIAFATGSGVTAPADFSGGSVGLSFSTVIDYLTDRFLMENGVDMLAVEKIAVPTIPARLELLAAGQLTAAAMPEPLASSYKSEFSAVFSLLKSLEQNPSILLVSDAFLAEHPTYMDAFRTAYDEAVLYCNEEDIDTYYQECAEFLSFPAGSEHYEYKPFIELIPVVPDEYQSMKEWALRNGLIQTDFPYEDLCLSDLPALSCHN